MPFFHFVLAAFVVLAASLLSCDKVQSKVKFYRISKQESGLIDPAGTTIATRFNLPAGFKRVAVQENSFAAYLRTLPLKPDGSEVKLYDGSTKWRNVYEAVVDMDIGKKDLQQCADAVMRLRGEYLYNQKQYDKIHFNFTNGFRVDYKNWMEGKRIVVSGDKTSWAQKGEPLNTYQDFRKYMEIIFSYAGTLSLSKELVQVQVGDMQIGDVFIQGGSPGHAVIVVDMAVNEKQEKLFMLAQSYMPAQETQVLKNPNSTSLSPWYPLSFGDELETPEWGFTKGDLKRFVE